jgi:(1->4)-alpha-D-glucan 1-alpha-D-glucosylmutase
MAKGFEDTLLYNYNRLLSLNEVGGSPEDFGVPLGDFYLFNKRIAEEWPNTLLATSTHDTKRGEDVRARLNVLSEIPEEWSRYLNEWSRINKGMRYEGWGMRAPDANEEYFIYQTLLGAWPFDLKDHSAFVERIKQYMLKGLREAKEHTSWLKPDKNYEKAALNFIDRILADPESNKFLKSFLPFQKKIAFYGIFNSLSQTIIKLTSPGVPDLYQGSELWDLNLVDPDNRRPVDYAKRKALLSEIKDKDPGEFLSSMEDGRIKLYVINMALRARESGDYVPLAVTGKFKDNIIAFARGRRITVAPRFLTRVVKEGELPIGKVWADTSINSPGGKNVAVAEILSKFPVAIYEQT